MAAVSNNGSDDQSGEGEEEEEAEDQHEDDKQQVFEVQVDWSEDPLFLFKIHQVFAGDYILLKWII